MMKKLHLFLFFAMVATLAVAQDFPTTSWSDLADTSWYDSEEEEYTINTAEALAGVSQLVADGTTFAGKTIVIGADIDLDGNLWTPIGDYPEVFSGSVEGNEHVISNLWINTPQDDFAGLFGYTQNSSFNKLHIDTAHIIGFDSVGSLVANLFDNGSIIGCSAINVTVTGNDNTGGLVGGIVTNSSVLASHAIGDITGSNQVGGVAGSGWDKIEMIECYSEGSVTTEFAGGGLIGAFPFSFGDASTVKDCYSRSSVMVLEQRAGGLIGGADNALTLKNAYSTGAVSASLYEGGTIGFLGSGIEIENVYFDLETSGMTEGVGGFGGDPTTPDITAKTTAEMKDPAMVDLLNANTADGPWSIVQDLNDGYPVLNMELGVEDHSLNSSTVKIYPTVVEKELNISSSLELRSFHLYNITGVLVAQGKLNGMDTTLSLNSLSSGMYILNIDTVRGSIAKKFIKK